MQQCPLDPDRHLGNLSPGGREEDGFDLFFKLSLKRLKMKSKSRNKTIKCSPSKCYESLHVLYFLFWGRVFKGTQAFACTQQL